MTSGQARFLSWEFLRARIESGTPSVDRVAGSPVCEVVVEPGGTRLALIVRAPADPDEKLPSFASVECVRIGSGVKGYVQLSCTDRSRYQEFYGFVMAVTDRVQLQGIPVAEAIVDAADTVRDLLANASALKLEQQIGLWGELWVLRELGDRLGWKVAMESWIANGDVAEEHDFALPNVDLEVKTTNRELRHHHVSSPSQFTPKHGRPLFVASLQITGSGAGGISLADAVRLARAECPSTMSLKLEKSLKAVGWSDDDAARYPTRWTHRDEPRIIDASELPRLEIAGANKNRLVGWTYVVDVAGLGESAQREWTWAK